MRINTRGSTRQPIETLKKFVKKVLNLDESHYIFKIMVDAYYIDMVDIVSADDARIEEDTYYDDNGKEQPSTDYVKSIFKTIRLWNLHLRVNEGISRIDWDDRSYINEDTFTSFRTAIRNDIPIIDDIAVITPKPAPKPSPPLHTSKLDVTTISASNKPVKDDTPRKYEEI